MNKPKEKNQITQMVEKAIARTKNPAYRLRQALIKAREEHIKQIKEDAGLDKGL